MFIKHLLRLFLPTEGLQIQLANPRTNLDPSNLVNLVLTLFLQVLEQALVGTDRIHCIGKGVYVPIVNLDTVVENLRATALVGND